jgi:hypothetical protein
MPTLDQFRASLLDGQARLNKLLPRIEEARAKLRTQSLADIAARSGCSLGEAGQLGLEFMERSYIITSHDFIAHRADDFEAASNFIQSILLVYLATADGTPPVEHWISFHELPDGAFYEPAFRSYSGEELVRGLNGDVTAFRHAAEALHAETLNLGDAAYVFRVLPRLKLAIAMWAGDEDFPAQARVLFEATAPHYLSTDGLAILGGQLIGHMLKAVRRD